MAHRKVYYNHVEKLVKCLPMEDTFFITTLSAQQLLPGNTENKIKTLSTQADKASYFLNCVIKPALDVDEISEFEKLLSIMQNCEFTHVKKLADTIKLEIDNSDETKSHASGTRLLTATNRNGPKSYSEGAMVTNPLITTTYGSGKGMVKNAVFSKVKNAVCFIKSRISSSTGFIGYTKCKGKYCTILVTTNHIINTFDDAMGSQIIFENLFPDRNITLKGSEICVKNSFWCSPFSELDYTLVEIDKDKLVDPKTNKSLDISPLQLRRQVYIKDNDQVYIIQYVDDKELAFSSSVSRVLSPLLLYYCTTVPGASGSPLLKEVDGELEIVALHRGGLEATDKSIGYKCGTLIHEILDHLDGRPARPLPTNYAVQEALMKNWK